MTSISPPPPSRPARNAPPTADETLAGVNSLLAESVGRNTLAMVEGIRNVTAWLDRTDLLVALTLARLGRATLEELLADFHTMNVRVARYAVEVALVILEHLGLITHDDRGDVWQAVAR